MKKKQLFKKIKSKFIHKRKHLSLPVFVKWIVSISIIVVILIAYSCVHRFVTAKNVLGAETGTSSIQTTAANISTIYPLPSNFFGYDIQEIPGSDWEYAAGYNMTQLYPGNLRYPGSTANMWDWHTGDLFPQYSHFSTVHSPDTLGNLKTLVDLLKQKDGSTVVPIFVLNIETAATGYPNLDPNLCTGSNQDKRIADQIVMLEYAQRIGLPVEEVELGNEIYTYPSNDPFRQFNQRLFPTGKIYACGMNHWIAAIRKHFPNAKIAVSGFTSYETGSIEGRNCYDVNDFSERLQCWNKGLRENLIGADQIILHNYPPSELQGSTKDAQNADLGTDQGAINFFASAYNYFNLLSDVFHMDFQVAPWGHAYDQMIVTEHNMYDYPNGAAAGTWGHGLFTAIQALSYLNNNAIRKIDHFKFWGDAYWGATFNNVYDFVNPERQALPHSFSAGGLIYTEIGQATAQMLSFQKITFSENPIKDPSISGLPPFSSLVGYRFREHSDQSIIINLSSSAFTVNLTRDLAKYNAYDQLADTINNYYYGDPTKLKVYIQNRFLSAPKIILTPYSITRLFHKY